MGDKKIPLFWSILLKAIRIFKRSINVHARNRLHDEKIMSKYTKQAYKHRHWEVGPNQTTNYPANIILRYIQLKKKQFLKKSNSSVPWKPSLLETGRAITNEHTRQIAVSQRCLKKSLLTISKYSAATKIPLHKKHFVKTYYSQLYRTIPTHLKTPIVRPKGITLF